MNTGSLIFLNYSIDPDPRTQKTVKSYNNVAVHLLKNILSSMPVSNTYIFKIKIWSMLIGGGISWSGWYGISQGNYQRFIAIPSLRQSRMYKNTLTPYHL